MNGMMIKDLSMWMLSWTEVKGMFYDQVAVNGVQLNISLLIHYFSIL